MKAAHIHIFEKRILISLIAFIVLLVGMYGFLISSAIVNVIVREEMEQKISATYSHMSELESDYLAQKNAITLSLAYDLGFIDNKIKIFVIRTSLSGKELTLNQ